MKRNACWARYSIFAALIIGGVYVVTANFEDGTSLLSVEEMQNIRGTGWIANHSCAWTTWCSDSECDSATPPYLRTVSFDIQ